MFFKSRFLRFSRFFVKSLYLFNLFFNFNNFYFEFLGFLGFFKVRLNFFFFKISNNFLKIFSLNFLKSDFNNTGFIYSYFFNLIKGLMFNYEKKLVLLGVGYKVILKFNNLHFFLSYSHPIIYKIPSDIKIKIFSNEIHVSGINKQRVGEVSLLLINFKKPDVYKGKGIRYLNEKIFLKSVKKK
ncbi:MAG: 50S ribosomal protein L6 [Candidatus Nasuia deltocephalinicola]